MNRRGIKQALQEIIERIGEIERRIDTVLQGEGRSSASVGTDDGSASGCAAG